MRPIRFSLFSSVMALILVGVLALTPFGKGYGQKKDPELPGEKKGQAEETNGEEDSEEQRDEDKNSGMRRDPCVKRLSPDDKEKKTKKNCVPAGSSSGIAKGDFNGDGFGDLVVGVPNEDVGSLQDAGAVHIIYGSSAGLSAAAGPGDQFITKEGLGLGASAGGEFFGLSLAAGDFNGDRISDLAIGAPGEDQSRDTDVGAVYVVYGSTNGLTSSGGQFFMQGFEGLLEVAESGDFFGGSLSWGDFDADGFGDLAVGVSNEDVGSLTHAGAVHVIYGTSGGLTVARNQFWTQDSPGVRDVAEASDFFGGSLTAGDFNGDKHSDLAIGVALEDVGSIASAGAVNVLYGSPFGLTDAENQFWTQNTSGVLDTAEDSERFGSSLAAGDFNGDGNSDLAIGVPLESLGTIPLAGGVNLLYGSTASGLTPTGNQFWSQDSPSVEDVAEGFDHFGESLAAGDFNNDGKKDLVIGVPFEDVGSINAAGAVNVIYGSGGGLSATAVQADQLFTQNTAFIPDTAEANDRFGAALTAWDFNGDSFADLAIGVPSEDLGTIEDAGAVHVLASTGRSLNPAGSQFWTQDSSDIEDQAEAGDFFGRVLY